MGADISFLYKYEHLFRKERTMNLTGPRKILYFLVVRVGPTTKQMPTRCVFRSIAAFEPHTRYLPLLRAKTQRSDREEIEVCDAKVESLLCLDDCPLVYLDGRVR